LKQGATPNTVKVTLAYPDYSPFMEQAANRSNRRKLQNKFYNQAVSENTPLLAEAISIRARVADMLGYRTWADYQMELKMAEPDAVADFYDSVLPGLTAKAIVEREALEALLQIDHPDEPLSVWDWVYYDTQQARTDFGVDQNDVAEYFPLESVIEGMFGITGEVFGISYEAIEADTWHEDVRSYRITDSDSSEPIATFHLDLHPRDGKYTHAACFSLQKGCRLPDGSYRNPVAAVLANFTTPTDASPSLLKHDEVVTLFHEFGHVLHFCLTEVELGRFAGFDTEWDFVEAPSQIMENWTWDGDVLRRFAAHHDTGEPIPGALVAGLTAIRDHNIGLKLLRQAYYGNLDLQFHTSGPEPDLHAIDRQLHAITQLEIHDDTFFAASFGHLMGGYDAGYYGYLWSMVYGDDMFSVFEAEGVLSPEIGRRYRKEILASGASRDAIDHLRAFLGREPSTDAFLSKIGLD
jgi:Zn-dependent oligopeptidase